MRHVKALVLFLYFLFGMAPAVYSDTELDDLKLFTEDLPPYNYLEDGELKGMSVDLLLEMFRRAGIDKHKSDIILVPWSRGYAEGLSRKNTILFTTTRTKAREKLFDWVGPIGKHRQIFLARKKDKLPQIDDANFARYRYGVVANSSAEQKLQEAGLDPGQIVQVASQVLAVRLLARGRVDICMLDEFVASWALQELGYDQADFEAVRAFEARPLYFAVSLGTDDAFTEKLQVALDEIHKDGTQAALVGKYLPQVSAHFLPNSNAGKNQ